VAGEITERKGETSVQIKHVDEAEEKIEHDRVVEIIHSQPKQQQTALYSIILTTNQKQNNIFTGEIYDLYKELCLKIGLRPLTQRRISDIIGELDMLGIINAKVISKGRYGRTREISLTLPEQTKTKIKQTLEECLSL